MDKPFLNDEVFARRLQSLEAGLKLNLSALYGETDDFENWYEQVLNTAYQAYLERPEPLKALDIKREAAAPKWYQEKDIIGYMCYPERFSGDLPALIKKIPYLKTLGIRYLHLLSVLQARAGDNDGGFAITDYLGVNSHLGTTADLRTLTEKLRENGISLCLDFVFNHSADDHQWAQKARAGHPHYKEYYFFFEEKAEVDEYEQLLDEVFPETAPGNFTYLEDIQKHVWTTFYPYQWDLNYRNPNVFHDMFKNLATLANWGVEVFRIDATIYAWKEQGTHCRNLPQTHQLLRCFRALMDLVAPATALKAEAIAGARHVAKYFGVEKRARECQLAYHTPMMVGLWQSLMEEDCSKMLHMLRNLPQRPADTSWVHYIRCHDDIGWSTLCDRNGAAWGAGQEQIKALTDFYSGKTENSFSCGTQFQATHANNGSLASLIGVEQALQQDDDDALARALGRLRLIYATLYALDGIPIIYMGDEIALLNDYDYAKEPNHKDGRWLHRPKMNWDLTSLGTRHQALAHSLHSYLQRLGKARQKAELFSTNHMLGYPDLANPALFATHRASSTNQLLALSNFSAKPQPLSKDLIANHINSDSVIDLLTQQKFDCTRMEPQSVVWLVASRG